VRQTDNFRIDEGIVCSQNLDTQLVVLTVSTRLRPLVAKSGRGVPDLPRWGRVVLHVSTSDRGGTLRAEREGAISTVGKDVHLFTRDVAALANSPIENRHVFEHGLDN
jgi:hypothetical protein